METTLYAITDELAALMNSYDLCETESERSACQGEIQAVVEKLVKKVDGCAHYLAHLESQSSLASAEIDRLKKRRDYFEHMLDRLRGYIIRVMQMQNVKKLDGETNSLALRQNPPSVEITDLDLVPAEYKTVRTETSPNKTAPRKAMEGGADIPGADLVFASVTLVRR